MFTQNNMTECNNETSGVSMPSHSCRRVAVEGNIGCGKTTFLEHFGAHPNVEVLAEPVQKWMDVNGSNLLDLMYCDAKRWCTPFQSYVALTMLQNHTQEQENGHVKMIERTIYSARHCFVENLHQKKLMSDMDYAVLDEWFEWIMTNADTQLDLIVYLKATPETCQKRIAVRNRSEESSVSLDYLQDLHKLHEDWLIHGAKDKLPAPVLVIDADKDLSEVVTQIKQLTPKILASPSS